MNKRLAYLIDTRLCNNCKTCEIACKMERRLPIGHRWRDVRRLETVDTSTDDIMNGNKHRATNVTMSCNHCEKPKCIEACPMYAYQKMPMGMVVQKNSRCIGCTKCVAACPYTAPVYNPSTNKTYKCDMCYDRIEADMQPYCVQTCPNGALKLDTYENLVAQYGENQDLTVIGDTTLVPDGSITNPSIVIVL